uniref:Uncharacterized protein n=1 Tax=Octopus bimaculoides TaxID=37653 RepID=A0A0L8H3F0_OCTBM
MVARLVKYKIRRIGHITRFEDSRLQTQLIYGELALRKHHQCKLKKRFHHIAKNKLKFLNISTIHWEHLALNGSKWWFTMKKFKKIRITY